MEYKRLSGMIALTEDECYCSITDFYDLVADKLGYDPQKVSYDCQKICVTNPIKEKIFEFFRKEQQVSIEAIATAWILYGPKASLPYDGYLVAADVGFIQEVAL